MKLHGTKWYREMANEFLITDVVSDGAVKQLQELNSHLSILKKNYTETAAEIGKGIGFPVKTFDDLNAKAKGYEDAVRKLAEAQREIIKLQGQYTSLLNQVNQKVREAVAMERQRRTEKQNYVLTLQEALKLAQQEVHSVNEANEANKKLRATVRTLRNDVAEEADAMQVLNEAIDRNSDVITQNSDAYTRQKRNVGNYASAWNGLGASVQQVVRELPSLTMGFNTFFLAISNNLPILVDQLKAAQEQVKAMREVDPSKAVPVWKQLLGSIFSWQTALIVGITVLSMYGKEIISWIGNLFKGKEEIDALKEAEGALHDARVNGLKDSVKERTELNLLYKTTQDTTRSMKERNAAVDELQKKYPKYFGNMSNEEVLAGKAKESYENLNAAIIANAQARAVQAKLEEVAARRLEYEIKANEAKTEMERLEVSTKKGTATESRTFYTAAGPQTVTGLSEDSANYRKAAKNLEEYNEELAKFDKQMEELAKHINVEELVFDGSEEAPKKAPKKWESKQTGNFFQYLHDDKTIEEMAKKQAEKVKEVTEEALFNTESNYAWMAMRATEFMQLELDDLTKQYKDGLLTKEEYEKQKNKIVERYGYEQLQTSIALLEEQINISTLGEEEKLKLQQKLSDARAKLAEKDRERAEEEAAKAEEQHKKELEFMKQTLDELEGMADEMVPGLGKIFDGFNDIFEKIADKQKVTATDILSSVASIAQGIGSLLSGVYDRQIEELEEQEEANEEAGEKEVERIEKLAETGAISEEEAEARKRAAEDKTARKNEEIAKKKAELQTKQAKLEKATNIITTIMNTAVAVMKALSQGGIFATPMVALISAMGAIQLATIIAQPIPKYAKGTKGHKGGMAIVGDGGKQEAVITDAGVWATPDVPTLVNLPKGAVVLPDLKDITSPKGMHSDLLLLLDRANKQKGDGVTVNVSNDYTRLEKRMDANASELRQIKKLLRTQGRMQERSWIYGRV